MFSEIGKMGYAVGIDLGTSNSCVAVVHNNIVDVICNDFGARTTPSVVSINESDIRIGQPTHMGSNISGVKQILGKNSMMKSNKSHCSFKVVNQIAIEIEHNSSKRCFMPQQIAALMLQKLCQFAENALNEKVHSVVIAAPASYNHFQRQALRDAGSLAGLKVLRVINESSAAALSYLMSSDAKFCEKARDVIIFDFGGGSISAAHVVLESCVCEVRAITEHSVGGQDLDSALLDHFLTQFELKHKINIRNKPRAVSRMLQACISIKHTLSCNMTSCIILDSLYKDLDFELSMTREKFEEVCAIPLHHCLAVLNSLKADTHVSEHDIHEIVLVGGCTRIPMVKKLVSESFEGKVVLKSVNADEAVASGAAIQAAILTNRATQLNAPHELLLIESTGATYGVATTISSTLSASPELNHCMTKVIAKNQTFPCWKELVLSPAHSNQSSASIQVYSGEDTLVSRNCLLGSIQLTGLTPTSQIKIVFDMDAEGTLKGTVADLSTGQKQTWKPDNNNVTTPAINSDLNLTLAI